MINGKGDLKGAIVIKRTIQKAAVLGSGVMGAGIAALLANSGISVLLLDIVPEDVPANETQHPVSKGNKLVRNRLSKDAIKRILHQGPAAFTSKRNVERVKTGNMEDDIAQLQEMDWIIEAVVENLEVKKNLFQVVEKYKGADTLVSTNTSGISIHSMVKERTKEFKSHFLGTHFFNPPRYMKLLEIIPHTETLPDVISLIKSFSENTLGKGPVVAADTPNFIANRIGTFGLLSTVHHMLESEWSIGEVDSLTGVLIGRPKSATFRTLDIVGLDTLLYVTKNHSNEIRGREAEVLQPPPFMEKMREKGWLGSKSKQGFYKKVKYDHHTDILEINPHTLEYEKRKKVTTSAVIQAKQEKDLAKRLKMLVYSDDDAGRFIWNLIKSLLLYTAEVKDQIAKDITAIDDAIRWGFGWELGPFELWDSIGVKPSIVKMEQEGETVPLWVKEMINKNIATFYKDPLTFYHEGQYKTKSMNKKHVQWVTQRNKRVIHKNPGATLFHAGEDVSYLELHSPNDAIGLDILQMIHRSIEETEKNFKGMVIGSQGKNFSVGANLMLILMEAQNEDYYEIEHIVRRFQETMTKIKYAKCPVVVAPHGMTLGGGAEICLPAASIQASSETYMGLVETGVGLIPGGGGNKELYLRYLERTLSTEIDKIDILKASNQVFERIALGTVSTSAEEAKENGYLLQRDRIIRNEEDRWYYGKQTVLELFDQGYMPPLKRKVPVSGEAGYASMKMAAKMMQYGGRATEYDMKVADKLAFVLAGGKVRIGEFVDEEYLLDLEREAFLSLVGEPKTQERMKHMLIKGKPLRN
ncbi:3-hydroxyacyl-CoA dehydrogenase [Alteribacillus iranensis]|uniref:3-hydroxyacyl-CoA dehydrogenase n=1 Tax=Alteribacillus iranensis TaxID=930128 RepID=A0A1I2EN94_9BACI|nr:3-hydroxyacyl-CoA dehydrogenase [Alteribacillus iranensis]